MKDDAKKFEQKPLFDAPRRARRAMSPRGKQRMAPHGGMTAIGPRQYRMVAALAKAETLTHREIVDKAIDFYFQNGLG
jgi:hypothetical protein